MNFKRYNLIATIVGCSLISSGCSTGRMFYDRPRLVNHTAPPAALLLADFPEETSVKTASTKPAATQPAAKPAYSAPSSNLQQMSFLTIAAASTMAGVSLPGAKEATESSISGSRVSTLGPIGAPSLGAPQARTLNAIVGQPGLQRGYAIGLGLAPRHNLFTRDIIPLTGTGGRCQDLINAGFFSNITQCQNYFRR
ncbi:MAG: hypothetical protein ACYTF1_02225 [Planctomycetota bacterium]|jgi:hypothetical protein